jgi:hypothetical protein
MHLKQTYFKGILKYTSTAYFNLVSQSTGHKIFMTFYTKYLRPYISINHFLVNFLMRVLQILKFPRTLKKFSEQNLISW